MEVQDASFPFPLVDTELEGRNGTLVRKKQKVFHLAKTKSHQIYFNILFSFSPDLSFRDDVIHHHINHRPGSKRQRIRQQGFCQDNGEGTQQPSNRLDHAAELSIPDGKQQKSAALFRFKVRLLSVVSDTVSVHMFLLTKRLSMLRPQNPGAAGSPPSLLGNSECQCRWPNFCGDKTNKQPNKKHQLVSLYVKC